MEKGKEAVVRKGSLDRVPEYAGPKGKQLVASRLPSKSRDLLLVDMIGVPKPLPEYPTSTAGFLDPADCMARTKR